MSHAARKQPYRKLTDQEQSVLLAFQEEIHYSTRYKDDDYEYRHVILPKLMLKSIPKDYFDHESGTLRLLHEDEWRGLGITQHYASFWQDQGYSVRYIPVYQAGIMQASWNVPPMTVPAKGRMSARDSQRWAKLLGVTIVSPSRFPVDSLACARILTVIARSHGSEKLALAMATLWRGFWGGEGYDISNSDDLRVMLSRVFTSAEVDMLIRLSGDAKVKQTLKENTARAVEDGAFGCPWIEVVTVDKEKSDETREHFFGNDRWIHICRHANLRWDGYAIVGGGEKSSI